MTITNETSEVVYEGNDATTSFPFQFLIPVDALVVLTSDGTTETTLDPADYSVTGLGDENGGSVTYNPAGGPLSPGQFLIIQRALPYTQIATFENQQRFLPSVLGDTLDRITMLTQQLKTQASRYVLIGRGSDVTPETAFSALLEARNEAQEAAHNASATLENFETRYLGGFSADPATDNLGNALAEGALYFNTTNSILRVFREGAWASVEDSGDGSNGISLFQASIFRRSAAAPSTPTGGQYDFGAQTLTPPSGWSASIPSGTDPLYVSQALAAVSEPTGVDTNLTWSGPVILAQDGTDGANGADGTTGKSVYTAIVFRRSLGQPSAPTGGSMNFGSNTLTPPTGWFLDVPSGTDPIWGTRQVFAVLGDTGTDAGGTWSDTFAIAEDGVNGVDGQNGADGISTYLASIFSRSNTTPATPTGGSYDFGTQALVPPASWYITVPSGTDPLWVSTALAVTQGTTGTHLFESGWSAPVIQAKDGADGANGADGTDGDTIITGRVYYQTLQASSPTTPSAASYDPDTGTFTSLTANWAVTQPPVEATDTNVQEWSSGFTVTIDGTTAAQTLSFSTPVGAIQFTATIESDNFVEGTSGWQINRATGAAEFAAATIRGELAAGQINIDGLTLTNDAGQLVVKDGGITTVKVGDNQITESTNAFTSGSGLFESGGTTSGIIQSVTVALTAGDKIKILGSAFCEMDASSSGTAKVLSVLKIADSGGTRLSGEPIARQSFPPNPVAGYAMLNLAFFATIPATDTYTFEWEANPSVSSTPWTMTYENRSLDVILIKK